MIYILPFIAALIGWFTNFLAVKMLFHPKEPIKVLFFEIQGIFPKRQKVLAKKLGNLVARELVSFKDIESKFTNPENLQSVLELVRKRLNDYLDHKFPVHYPLLAVFVGDAVKEKFSGQAMEEIEQILPEAIESYIKNLESTLDIETMVMEKVEQFSSDKLERIVQMILEKEFRFIEIVGAVLGFVIGCIQVGLMLLTM